LPPGQAEPSPPSPEAAYQGLTVTSINFPGLSGSDPERMRQVIPQKIATPLDRDLIRQSIRILYATGRFADIRVEAEKTSRQEVALTFITQPNYFVGVVSVEGAPTPPAANQVANASRLQLGELFTKEKLDAGLDSIKRLLVENGYYKYKITAREVKHEETQQIDIAFHISSGPVAQVGEVNVTGDSGLSQGQVQDIAKLHPLDTVSVQRISRALDRLRNRYQKRNRLLAQITIASKVYRAETNKVDYTFAITPGPKVDLTTEGFRISRGVLKKSVPIYEEGALDDDLLNEGRRNLINYLQGRGYFEAKVTLNKKPSSSGDELRILYDIDAGARHKLVKVGIVGNKYFPTETLVGQLRLQPAGRFLSRGRYSQAILNDDIRGLEAQYRNNGFEQVKVTSMVEDSYEGRVNQIAVTLKIDEGPQTLVSALRITGNQTLPESEFPAINEVPGQPYSESNIAADRDIILNYYLNSGFPDASLEAAAHPAADSANHMDVTYTIHEGERIFVSQVILAGLDHTRRFVVQREIELAPGDPLSQKAMLDTQRNLYGLLIFSQVNTAVQNPNGQDQQKNVLVEVQEAKRYTFNYGFGFEFQTGQPAIGTNQPLGETGVSPRVSFGVTRLNLRGRNNTVTFKGNVGRLQQRGLLSYEAPRLLNSRNWRLTLTSFYDNTLDVTTFTSQRLEGTAQVEQVISRRVPDGTPTTIMDYRFTYRRVKATDLEISSDQIPLLSQPTRVGIPNFTFVRNRRDNDLDSTKGSYNTIDGGVADSHFASETDFGRLLIQNTTYYSFGKDRRGGNRFVFARSTRIGVETPFGNTFMPAPGQACSTTAEIACLPLAERFFSGGGNSHRGFGLNQAGPRDPNTGFPLGGTALFLNNLELRMPPPTLPYVQQNLSFTIFHDAGNVFTYAHDMFHNLDHWKQRDPQLCLKAQTAAQCNYNYISHALGLGVRYKTPVGPVRFDFGYNLNPPQFPSCQIRVSQGQFCSPFAFKPQQASHFNVFFSVGQTF